jgi:hypothetical protein
MSAVSIPPIIPDQDYLKGLIRSILKEEPELVKSVIKEDKDFLKGSLIELLKEDKEFREYVVELVTPELKKRVNILEEKVGLADKYHLDEDTEALPEIVTGLEARINKIEKKMDERLEPRKCELGNFPQTKTDYSADYLLKYMSENGKIDPNDEPGITHSVDLKTKERLISVDGKQFKKFIKYYLPEKFQPRSFNNIRKLKKDILLNAERRYPSLVWTHKVKGGNCERLLLASECDQALLGNSCID